MDIKDFIEESLLQIVDGIVYHRGDGESDTF